jgi:hypothetical protein
MQRCRNAEKEKERERERSDEALTSIARRF